MTRFVDCLRKEAENGDHQIITPSGGLYEMFSYIILGVMPFLDLEIGRDGVYSRVRFFPEPEHCFVDPERDKVYSFELAEVVFLDEKGGETCHRVQAFLHFNGEVQNEGMSCGTLRMWPLFSPVSPTEGTSNE